MIELSPRDKQDVVQSLWSAWNNGNPALDLLPKAIRSVLQTEAWREREVDGKMMSNASFREFVLNPPLQGCGWKNQIDAIEKVLGLKDPDVLRQWREAMTGEQGAHHNNIMMKATQGTGKAYTLDRLSRNYPEIYARVIAGELSANAAAIEAGFRKKPVRCCPNCGHTW